MVMVGRRAVEITWIERKVKNWHSIRNESHFLTLACLSTFTILHISFSPAKSHLATSRLPCKNRFALVARGVVESACFAIVVSIDMQLASYVMVSHSF